MLANQAQAIDYWWDGFDSGDGYSWSVPGNWSTVDSVANGGPTMSGSVPGAGDILHWAFDDPDPNDPLLRSNVTHNIVLGGPRQIATFVNDGTVLTKAYPYLDNFTGGDPAAGVQPLLLTGSNRDLSGGFMDVPNVVLDVRQSTTFAPLVNIQLPGGQDSVVHVTGGTQLRIDGGITSTGADAGLKKLGFDTLNVKGGTSVTLTGTLELSQGTLAMESPVTAARMLVDSLDTGDYKKFQMFNGVNHTFGTLEVDRGDGTFFSLPDGTYTQAQLANISTGISASAGDTLGDFFVSPSGVSTGTITIAPITSNNGDFDHDGDTDGHDFLVWQRNPSVGALADWQAGYGIPLVAAVGAVPEPSSLVLACCGVLLFARRERRNHA